MQQQSISYLGLTGGTTDVEGDDIVIVELCQLWPDFCRSYWSRWPRWHYLWTGVLRAHQVDENRDKRQQNGKRQEGLGACSETCPFAFYTVWHDDVVLWIGIVLIKRLFDLHTHLFLELGVLSLSSNDFFFQLFEVFIVSHNCNFDRVIIIAVWSEKNSISIIFGEMLFSTIIMASYFLAMARMSRI